MKDRFCFSKKTVLLLSIFILAIIGITLVNKINRYTFNLKSKASEIKPFDIQPIIGGQPAKAGEFPYVALIRSEYETGLLIKTKVIGDCTGVLIDPRWVLIAAHCLEKYNDPSVYKVALDIVNIDDFSKKSVAVEKIIRHKNFNYDFNYDIGLIKLKKSVSVKPITLPKNTDTFLYTPQTYPTFLGYGIIGISPTPGVSPSFDGSNYVKISSKVLNKISLPIVNAYPTPIKGQENLFYFGYIGNMAKSLNVAKGDSGGPIIVKDKSGNYLLAGIIVKGDVQSNEYSGGLKITNFIDWITTTKFWY